MNKDWFILVDGKSEGPYSPSELRAHPKVTPDTLVKKKDWEKWIAIRYVSELKNIFKDKPRPKPLNDEQKAISDLSQNQAILTLNQDPFYPYLWLLLILSLLIYLIYLVYE